MAYSSKFAQVLDDHGALFALAISPAAASKIVGALNGSTPAPTPTPSPTASPGLLGAYAGAENVAGVRAFETGIGRHVDLAHDYLDERQWGSISDPSWYWQGWRAAGFTRLLLGVPLTCDGTPLADVAAGKHDADFTACAKSLAGAGFAWVTIRLGWEFNGGWYPWAESNDTTNYVAAFRRVAAIFRANVPGIKIEWCISCQSGQPKTYPGDDVIDVIAGDAYDMTWQGAGLTPADRWARITNTTDGLGWVAATAQAHGKLIGVPEWGCSDVSADSGGGGGDDPIYIANMYAWLVAHHAAYACYFPAGDLVGPKTPRALAQFKSLWTS